MMMEYNEFHEVESVILRGARLHSRLALHAFLLDRGYQFNDDFHRYYLDRSAVAEQHQSISLVEIHVLRDRARSEEYEEAFTKADTLWDGLEAEYLLASLPRDCIAKFVQECAALTDRFELSMYREELMVSEVELRARLDHIAAELTSEHGEPGSLDLAIQVESTYPRKPRS